MINFLNINKIPMLGRKKIVVKKVWLVQIHVTVCLLIDYHEEAMIIAR